jgi:hypothetical protein
LKRFVVTRALHVSGIDFAYVSPFHRVRKSQNGGFSLILKIQPGASGVKLQEFKENLLSALNYDEIEIRRLSPRKFELRARKGLPSKFPVFEVIKNSDVVPKKTPYEVPIGIDADGAIAKFSLFDDAGGTVSLIAGNPGTGKSSALRILVASLLPTSTAIVWLDPKGGADASIFASRVEAIPDCINADVAIVKLREINELILRRSRALATGVDGSLFRELVVFVDEWATLGVHGTKKGREAVDEQLRSIAATGRAAKVTLVLATQRPTSTNIDVSTRGLATTRLVFAVMDRHASIASLGYSGAELLHPKEDRGIAILNDSTGLRKVRVYKVPENLREVAQENSGLRTTLEELSLWEMATLKTS